MKSESIQSPGFTFFSFPKPPLALILPFFLLVCHHPSSVTPDSLPAQQGGNNHFSISQPPPASSSCLDGVMSSQASIFASLWCVWQLLYLCLPVCTFASLAGKLLTRTASSFASLAGWGATKTTPWSFTRLAGRVTMIPLPPPPVLPNPGVALTEKYYP